MTNIDIKIKEIFNLILSDSKYYLGNIENKYSREYTFEINGVKIILRIFKKCKDDHTSNTPVTFKLTPRGNFWPTMHWDLKTGDDDLGVSFYLNIEDKQYIVPELTFKEQAEAIEKFENILKEHELSVLDTILN